MYEVFEFNSNFFKKFMYNGIIDTPFLTKLMNREYPKH